MAGLRSRVPGAPKSRWPLGLIGMLSLIAAVDSSIARRSRDLTLLDNWEWRLNGQAARRKVAGYGVLAVGSSQIKLGILPRAIEPVVGRRVYNLGMCAGPAPASFFLLKRALDSGARPSAVVVEFHPMNLWAGYRHTAPFWPDLLTVRECLDLSWTARDADFFGRVMLAALLPSVKDRFEIRKCVDSALKGEPRSRVALLAMKRTMLLNQGAKIVPKVAGGRHARLPADDLSMAPGTWACEAVSEVYIRRLFEMLGDRGIPVVWLLPPVRHDLQAVRESTGVDRLYKEFARHLQGEYPHVMVVDGTHAAFAPDLFIDAFHLDRDGALALSTELAPILRDALNRPAQARRWVSLPGTRARPAEVAFDDFGQSVRAVKAVAAGAPGGERRTR